MPNIKFSYLYRDGGNYKTWGEAFFGNPDNLSIAEIEAHIKSKLIDDTYFYHKEFGVPSLIPNTFDYDIDPTWHEFESVSETCESRRFFAIFMGIGGETQESRSRKQDGEVKAVFYLTFSPSVGVRIKEQGIRTGKNRIKRQESRAKTGK